MKIWRQLILGALCVLAAAAISSCSRKPQLHLFIWSEYIDPAVIRDFENRFGCHVTVDLYEDEETMMSKLQNGGAGLYDVVVPPGHTIPVLAGLNLLEPLRKENLPHLSNLDDQFLHPPFDPENRYSVAYQWGTMGIYLRRGAGTNPVPSWSLLFGREPLEGGFVLIDSARDLIGAALQYAGHSLNSTNAEDLRAARDLLLNAKKKAVAMDGSVGGKNKVLGKLARAAMVYSGEGARGMKEDPETVYLVPKEGSQIWVDNLAIPAGAPHRDLAEQFIDFVLEPENSARISNFTQFATPNRAARQFIRPEDLANEAIYPPAEVMPKLEYLKDVGTASRLYDEVWTSLKSE